MTTDAQSDRDVVLTALNAADMQELSQVTLAARLNLPVGRVRAALHTLEALSLIGRDGRVRRPTALGSLVVASGAPISIGGALAAVIQHGLGSPDDATITEWGYLHVRPASADDVLLAPVYAGQLLDLVARTGLPLPGVAAAYQLGHDAGYADAQDDKAVSHPVDT